MERYFRTEKGKLVDILDYTGEQIAKNPDVKIYIGCDSQVFGPEIKFVISIVYRVGVKGGHCIYRVIKKSRPPKNVPKEVQVHERLMEEVYMTMELAQFFIDNSSIKLHAVEFDFNEEEIHMSNKLLNLATGWAKGLNLPARTKPEELIACKYSDHICRT
jgi:predicted RNase H-related nuclease YkuK (DUF458 family)